MKEDLYNTLHKSKPKAAALMHRNLTANQFSEGCLTDIHYVDRELVQLARRKTVADLKPPK